MSKVSVSVSVSDDHVDRFPEVVEQARAAGLDVAQELDVIGVVSGSIDEELVEDLRSVPGVAAVESERDYQIAPPDSAIQSAPQSSDAFETPDQYGGSSSGSSDYESPETSEQSATYGSSTSHEPSSGYETSSDYDPSSDASHEDLGTTGDRERT